jgi:hypothetical protein
MPVKAGFPPREESIRERRAVADDRSALAPGLAAARPFGKPARDMHDQLWVELVGDLIVARVRGEPTQALLRECQDQVVFLVRDAGRGKVLYDALEMTPPPVEVTLLQRELDEGLAGIHLRRAIVVPNSRLAYLARLAFGEGDYRVFYNDIVTAVQWLSENPSPSRLTKIK